MKVLLLLALVCVGASASCDCCEGQDKVNVKSRCDLYGFIPARYGSCKDVCCDDVDCHVDEICDHIDNDTICSNGLARGMCIPMPAGCTQCTVDADCNGELCDPQMQCCVPGSSTCTSSADCDPSLICADNQCIQPSGGNDDGCRDGFWCCLETSGGARHMCFRCPQSRGHCIVPHDSFCDSIPRRFTEFAGTTWIGNDSC